MRKYSCIFCLILLILPLSGFAQTYLNSDGRIKVVIKLRKKFCKILAETGYKFIPPKGAFYIFPQAPIADDAEFVGKLQEQKILAVPGRGFGTPGYFRLAFCVEDAVIERSAEAFQRAMASIK